MKFTLLSPRVLANGRSSYLGGVCEWEGRLVEAYAMPADKIPREQLESLLQQPVTVVSDEPSFVDGAGLLLSGCHLPDLAADG